MLIVVGRVNGAGVGVGVGVVARMRLREGKSLTQGYTAVSGRTGIQSQVFRLQAWPSFHYTLVGLKFQCDKTPKDLCEMQILCLHPQKP